MSFNLACFLYWELTQACSSLIVMWIFFFIKEMNLNTFIIICYLSILLYFGNESVHVDNYLLFEHPSLFGKWIYLHSSLSAIWASFFILERNLHTFIIIWYLSILLLFWKGISKCSSLSAIWISFFILEIIQAHSWLLSIFHFLE